MEYEKAALTEWDEAARGRTYPPADQALHGLRSAYERVQARTDVQKTMLANSFTDLDNLSQARTQRVLQARTDVGPPWSLWAVIFLTGGLLPGLRGHLWGREACNPFHNGCHLGCACRHNPFSCHDAVAPIHRRNRHVPGAAARGHARAVDELVLTRRRRWFFNSLLEHFPLQQLVSAPESWRCTPARHPTPAALEQLRLLRSALLGWPGQGAARIAVHRGAPTSVD